MSRELTHQVHEDEVHDHDRGLTFDLSTLMSRRRALQLFAVGGLTTLVGCGASSGNSPGTTSSASGSDSTSSTTGAAGSETR